MVISIVDLPSLPVEEPVYVFALALCAFLLGPLAIKRVGLPGIVSVVLIGALLGPNGLGIVDHSDAIVLLGEVGLIYLLFTVGLELDLQGFSKAPENAALFGLTSFGIPFVIGTAACVAILGLNVWAGMLLSAVFASHTLLAYPVVNQLGVTQNRAVTAVFGGILFTDTLALFVLPLVTGAVAGGLTIGLFGNVVASLAVLFAAIWFIVPRIGRWFFQNLSDESYFEFLFVAAALFSAASLAELLGVAPILGAFLAGIALNRLVSRGGTLLNRVEFVGSALFVPFFLLHVGMLVDPTVILDGVETLWIAAVIIGVMLATKWLAAWLVARLQGYSAAERDVLFGLSIGQAAAALAITLIGFERGLFDATILNAVVLMLLVTAVLSPWLTQRAASRLALSSQVEPDDGSPTDLRLLLPLSHNAKLQRRLLELALVLKAEDGTEPVHVLTVVQPNREGDTEERISHARNELRELVAVGDAAEVPVDVETRVNHNVASGVAQSALEVEADAVLMGWDATTPFSKQIFGSVIDQVLRRTRLPVVISRLGHPINTTRRIFVVLPMGVDHHEGFFEALTLLKRLAARLGTPMTIVVVDGKTHQFERLFELVEPELPADFEAINSWDALVPWLSDETEPDDLVTVLSPRRGDVGWHDQLASLPGQLAELPPHSFVVVHPRENDPEYDRRFLQFE
ncbi:MAG: cation:proton antiporter [Halohasta sp.]